jgi:hypothetical protein
MNSIPDDPDGLPGRDERNDSETISGVSARSGLISDRGEAGGAATLDKTVNTHEIHRLEVLRVLREQPSPRCLHNSVDSEQVRVNRVD